MTSSTSSQITPSPIAPWYAILHRYSYDDEKTIDDENIAGFTDDLDRIVIMIRECILNPSTQFIKLCQKLKKNPPPMRPDSVIISDRHRQARIFDYGLIQLGEDFREILISKPASIQIQSKWTEDGHRHLSRHDQPDSLMCHTYQVPRL